MSRKKRFPFIKERGESLSREVPQQESPCKYSKECGGCSYIHIAYSDELQIKQKVLTELFGNSPWADRVEGVQSSPVEYGHRSKITLQMLNLQSGQMVYGNCPYGSSYILEIDRCQVAHPVLSEMIPQLRAQLEAKDTSKYRRASLSLRCDLSGKSAWGGLGKGSLRQTLDDGFHFEHLGIKIQFSMQTFFQSNLHILPKLLDFLDQKLQIGPKDVFYDLYGGVGLFGLVLGRKAHKVHLIEINPDSILWAQHNQELNALEHLQITIGAVEDHLDQLRQGLQLGGRHVAMIDPPRCGLHADVIKVLRESEFLDQLVYLSCNPDSQKNDLLELCATGHWDVEQIVPWDFFPKSYHIESLAILKRV